MPHQKYIQRCFDLARLGSGSVSPNPMVGAVLVFNEKIIGEGYHQKYGGAHAEVNALQSVPPKYQHLIKKSTLYVSLEPCCIFGKTPPCTNLILKHQIPKVVISCLDETPNVAGQGVQILKDAGIEVSIGVLAKKGQALARIRNTFVTRNRPYTILKFAKSRDNFIGMPNKQIWISNIFAKRLVHKWRSEIDAILVGTKTAITDQPQLTNRLYFGKSPLRILLDRQLSVPLNSLLFTDETITWVLNEKKEEYQEHLKTQFIHLPFNKNLLPNLFQKLAAAKITTLLVEGGALTLEHFIKANLWDEARIFTSPQFIYEGIPAPSLQGEIIDEYKIKDNLLTILRNSHHTR